MKICSTIILFVTIIIISNVTCVITTIHADPSDVFRTTQKDQFKVNEITSPAYYPTPVQEIRLKGFMFSQQQRIYLNVGGTKFETSVSTLETDPSS